MTHFEEQQVMPSASTRFHHVANGTATTDIIHLAGIPGTSSIWADPLHDGPVPGGLSDEELLEVRARYLADGSEGSLEETISELRSWRAALDNTESYDELVLWYEHDLFDQLNLVHVLGHVRRTVAGRKPVSLVCIGSFPGRPRFKGLGELTPDEIASLFDTRQSVSEAQYALAEVAWSAFGGPDPQQVERVLAADTSALPFLAAALRRHLEEYPSAFNGLSRTEHRVMELARTGPIDVWTAFPRMHDTETAFYIADLSFWRVVRSLASTSPPLVAAASAKASASQVDKGPRITMSLTEIGRAVLDGELDRVARCGLERWLGGVRLSGTDHLWRWDEAKGRVVLG
jgi:hypothetical protein